MSEAPIDLPALLAAARLAGLPLTEARARTLLPQAQGLLALVAPVNAQPLGDTPPALSFDPRWED